MNSPWDLILTEPVPEVVEFRPADWPQKFEHFWNKLGRNKFPVLEVNFRAKNIALSLQVAPGSPKMEAPILKDMISFNVFGATP